MMVLWLLIVRGVAIEFRNHLDNSLWRPFFDVLFTGGSTLLAPQRAVELVDTVFNQCFAWTT